jgi:hypothetical protein
MARTAATKHVAILAIGTLILFLGAIIAAVGAFRSVMHDPKTKGPYEASNTLTTVANNRRHYVALISYFPEIFHCGKVQDIHESTASDAELVLTTLDVQEAAAFYCWRESGDAVWLYAFGFVILFVYLILAFIAAFRRSGHQAALGGLGFSVVIITWALLVIVHFQEHNNIPRALYAFGDCDTFTSSATARANYDPWTPSNVRVNPDFGVEVIPNFLPSTTTGVTTAGGTAPGIRAFYYQRYGGTDTFDETLFTTNTATNFANDVNARITPTSHGASTAGATTYFLNFNRSPARIFGPTPRRSWICNEDWDYSSTLRITRNLIYGGIATLLLGALLTTTSLAYLAFPILGVVKAPTGNIQAQRASNLAADVDYTVDYVYDETY